jgi:ParB family transcriptional regulator, chromosome partitioning protein
MSWESFVKSRLSLLNLADNLLDAVRAKRIEYTKAQSFARVEDKEQRLILLEQAIAQGWSLAQIKKQVALLT